MRTKRNTTFSLPCYRKFKNTFGKFNALINFEEVAALHLFAEKGEVESMGEVLTRIAPAYGLHISDVRLPHYEIVLRQAFLNHPFACFEVFLEDFKEEYKTLVNPNFVLVNEDDMSKLEKYSRSLKEDGVIPQLSGYLMDMYNYYRLVRNQVVHHLASDRSVKNAFKRLEKRREEILTRFEQMPNPLESIDFNDFKLCDQVILDIAELFSISIEKHIDWETIDCFEKGIVLRSKVNKFRDNPKRLKKYIDSSFMSVFGIKAPLKAINRIRG